MKAFHPLSEVSRRALRILLLASLIGGLLAAGHPEVHATPLFAFGLGFLIILGGPLTWTFAIASDGEPFDAIPVVILSVFVGTMIVSHSVIPLRLFHVLTYVGLTVWLYAGVVALGAAIT